MTRRELEYTARLEDRLQNLIIENIRLKSEIDRKEKQIVELSNKLKEYIKNEAW